RLLGDSAGLEEVGEIGGVGCIAQIWSDVENILPGAQIGRVGVVDGTGVGLVVHIGVGAIGDDDFADGVAEVVGIVAGDAVLFGFVKPNDDDAMVFVGFGRHDHGNDLAEEVITLQDFCGIAGETLVAGAE